MILDHIRVLDMSKVLAGPHCSMILADMGADVIKIESFEGDDTRNISPKKNGEWSGFFTACNVGKRSVVLNLKDPEAVKAFLKLAETADVIIENMKTGIVERLGVSYQDVFKINPRIIYCSISGYGRTGPLAKKGGYDMLCQASFGMMSVTGEGPNRPPVRVGYSVTDIGTGMNAAIAILGAIIEREKTNRGQHVMCSLMQTQMSFSSYYTTNFGIDQRVPIPEGSASYLLAPHQAFKAKDGYVIIATSNQSQWIKMCKYQGFQHLVNHPQFQTMPLRVLNRTLLQEEIEIALQNVSVKQIIQFMDDVDVPAASVNNIKEVLEDEFFYSANVDEVDHPGIGTMLVPKPPYTFSVSQQVQRLPAPKLGSDTFALLKEAGYSEEELIDMQARNIIQGDI